LIFSTRAILGAFLFLFINCRLFADNIVLVSGQIPHAKAQVVVYFTGSSDIKK